MDKVVYCLLVLLTNLGLDLLVATSVLYTFSHFGRLEI